MVARTPAPGAESGRPQGQYPARRTWTTPPTRKPLLFQLFGLFLLRYEQRALLSLLFHDPPRTSRGHLPGGLTGQPRDTRLTDPTNPLYSLFKF